MKWLQKGFLPPKVKEQMVSQVGDYQAGKLTVTLLNGTLIQKVEIIRDLKLKNSLRVCYNCGTLIDEVFSSENTGADYCSKKCAMADSGHARNFFPQNTERQKLK